jgi:hypothetical protein
MISTDRAGRLDRTADEVPAVDARHTRVLTFPDQ